MQISRFIKLLGQHITPSEQDLSLLKLLIKEYPYCSLAHALIAKATYKTTKDIDQRTVQQAATYVINRGHFKKWLENKLPSIPTQKFIKPNLQKSSCWSCNDYIKDMAQKSIQKGSNDKNKQQFLITDSMINKLVTFDPFVEPFSLTETVPVIDLSAQNGELSHHTATETLAKLMVQQKKYRRAIEIYKQLIIKYPEKKSYLSAVIVDLESKK